MKKSNKLILGGFLAVVLFISAIHITLYAKYKAGDYTLYNAQDDLRLPAVESFPDILVVSVLNIPHATVRFAKAAGVEKSEEEGIQYVRKGDTLLITGHNQGNQSDFREDVAFNLPHNATVSLDNSSISFDAGAGDGENSPVVYLKKSAVLFNGRRQPLRFGNVKIIASDSSAATFMGNTHVNNLDVQLSNSSLEYMNGNLGQLSIVTDSLSRLSLSAKHLLKATIKTITKE